MKKILLILAVIIIFFISTISRKTDELERATFWDFQAIDTMKYSRDVAREKLTDPSFNVVIDEQIKNIADTGATHVAIATPYDEEFLPIMRRWVASARKHNLKIWYRGNWSGWEGWFGYEKIDRKTHSEKTRLFILEHEDLFQDGDIFTACPECENGGPGDPRLNNDKKGHQQFLIDEHEMAVQAFSQINKNVSTNYNSMNGDVARLIMDQETTKALGGLVVVDHYVASPDKLVFDIQELAKNSGGKIILGEFGAPIGDINGQMTEDEQKDWIEEALYKMAKEPSLIGASYWVNVGGSTELWDAYNNPRSAVSALTKVYSPQQLTGRIIDETGKPIANAQISNIYRETTSNKQGKFVLPFLEQDREIQLSSEGYTVNKIDYDYNNATVVVAKNDPSFFYKTLATLRQVLHIQ